MRSVVVSLAGLCLVGALGACGPAPGQAGAPCRVDGTCDGALICLASVCVRAEDCAPGLTGACSCADGRPGTRACDAAGVWGGCQCESTCGNDVCESREEQATCPADCAPRCGDGVCTTGETATGCPADCMVLATNKVDLLFVIDNTSSMAGKQAALGAQFGALIQPLMALPRPPDLHIGIVTSDVGAGPYTCPSCEAFGGDQGILQNAPKGATCGVARLANDADRFLTLAPDGAGGWTRNFSGSVEDAFACYAAVGTSGCAFEQPLESVSRALEGCETDAGCTQPDNVGFLRRDAYLAVIVFSEHDDCSASPDTALFDPTQTALDSELGPLTPYRCFEFGIVCGGADPGRDPGPREACFPDSKDPDERHQLTPTARFAMLLKVLKPQSPRLVYASVIAAPPGAIEVGADADGNPTVLAACSGGIGPGDPALRLKEFVSWFDYDRASFLSLCQPEFAQAMQSIARDLTRLLSQ